ncbi:hypothetical protein ACIOG7_28580 [Streptomyces sp. NPDC087894]|uniref:hypothetical protein n=1 Tax=Streptomyces sp. NPDC087894 TaxID=3365816 RepID=UPI0038083B31
MTADSLSPVFTDTIRRLPVTVCRITGVLGERTAGLPLERAIASTGEWLKASMVPDLELDPDLRRPRSCPDFEASELLAAIDDVRERVEHTLGVDCRYTEPRHGLNVHDDGDFCRLRFPRDPRHSFVVPRGCADAAAWSRLV